MVFHLALTIIRFICSILYHLLRIIYVFRHMGHLIILKKKKHLQFKYQRALATLLKIEILRDR